MRIATLHKYGPNKAAIPSVNLTVTANEKNRRLTDK